MSLSKTGRNPTCPRNYMRVSKKIQALIAVILMVVTVAIGTVMMLHPGTAQAATHTFANGNKVTVSSDWKTIKGTCEVKHWSDNSGEHYPIVMPDGQKITGECIDRNHCAPKIGSHTFTATRNSDGSYTVTVNHDNKGNYEQPYAYGSTHTLDEGWFDWPPQRIQLKWSITGSLKLTKRSSKTSLTNGNPSYVLRDAEFKIYKDKACKTLYKTVTVTATATTTVEKMPAGKYYIKETKAPENYSIDLKTAKEVEVKRGKTASVTFDDTPDVASLKIVKESTDKSFGTTGAYSLKGAVYGLWETRTGISNGADGKAGTKDDVLWGASATSSNLTGEYTISTACGYGFIVMPKGSAKTAGTAIVIHGGTDTAIQKWYISKATGQGANSYYITNVSCGLRLGTSGKKSASGTKCVLQKASASDKSQVWDIVTAASPSGTYVIKNHANTKVVLDLTKSALVNDTQLGIVTANKGTNQSWKLHRSYVGKATSNDKGEMTFSNLVPNKTYYAREISGPTSGGYEMNYAVITIKTGKAKSTVTAKAPEVPAPKVSISTTAKTNGQKEAKIPSSGNVTITDTVKYTFTVPSGGKLPSGTFTLKGTLMDKATGKEFKANGKSVTATATFTATAKTGTKDMTFTFPASALDSGKDLVVYEDLWGRLKSTDTKDSKVAEHKDINDEGQTVKFSPEQGISVSIGTMASIAGKKSYVVPEGAEQVEIKDEVSYKFVLTNGATLPTGSFTLKGTLMDKATGAEFKVDGVPVTAATTFTPTKAEDTVTMTFTIPVSAITEKTTLVVYEELAGKLLPDASAGKVAEHKNLSDSKQTVTITTTPKPVLDIQTVATVNDLHEAKAEGESITIKDKVRYHFDLNGTELPVRQFRIKGVLMDKATGEQLMHNGQPIEAETTFTPESETGEEVVTFTVSPEDVRGKYVVVFERVYDTQAEGVDAVSEDDLENQDQTVSFPVIRTTATDDRTDSHTAMAREGETITINDEVAYSGLIPGQTYILAGTLHYKDSGETLQSDGQDIVSTRTFTPRTASGTVVMSFDVPATLLIRKTIVVFESLSHDGNEVATHADINDTEQSVTYDEPESEEISIGTTATDATTGTHLGDASGEMVTINDDVSYMGLEEDKTYWLVGTLMDKATGQPVQADGTDVTVTKAFVTARAMGVEQMQIAIPATLARGKSFVVFEELYAEEPVTPEGGTAPQYIACHKDIDDTGQTVGYLEIGTTATDKNSGTHDGIVSGDKVTINDEVKYDGLIPDQTYTMSGILMDKATGMALADEKGDPITATQEFTPKEPSGSITMTFEMPATLISGKTVVAFETLSQDEQDIASHADIEDLNQTVSYPVIHTTATDAGTGTHEGDAMRGDTVTINDEVRYAGLVPDTEYTLVGTVTDRETGKPLQADGKDITATMTFTPDVANGSVTLQATVPAAAIAGKTVVMFEEIRIGERLIAVHADINDMEQTVSYPSVSTTATFADTGGKDAPKNSGNVTIVDRVVYKGLTPGVTYTITGTLHDKEAEKASPNDTSVTRGFLLEEGGLTTSEFTPDASNGYVDISFTIDIAKALNKDLVVFEIVKRDAGDGLMDTIATHEDIDAESQTVHGPIPRTGSPSRGGNIASDLLRTGNMTATTAILTVAGAVVASIAGICAMRIAKRR